MIKNAIQSLLSNDGTIIHGSLDAESTYAAAFAILEPIVSSRVYAIQMPRNAQQYMDDGMQASIFYYIATEKADFTHDGPIDLTLAVIRIHCVATDEDQVSNALWAIGNMLGGWSGKAGQGTNPGKIVVQLIEKNAGADAFELPIGADQFGLAESMIELNVWYNNP
jgi:anaerobic glycerol-3-phosphate dehydrogenase